VPRDPGRTPGPATGQSRGATSGKARAPGRTPPVSGPRLCHWRLDRALGADAEALSQHLANAGFHSALVETVAYWQQLHRRGQPPARADIDPAEIRALLPHLALLDDATGDGRPRFRLAGTAVVELFGCEPTGRCVASLESPLRDFLLRCWAELAERGAADPAESAAPLAQVCNYRDDGDVAGGLYQYECAFLPLSDCFAERPEPGGARVLLCLLRRFISDAMGAPGRGAVAQGFEPL
jgi:hypothetical protein